MYKAKPTKWKFIKGSKGLYRVSEYGDIQNTKNEKQLKPSLQYYSGLLQINLKINNEYKNHQIHKLVATAFIKNPENKNHLIHLDYNKQNNHYSNLKWATIGEFNEHKKKFDSFIGVIKEEVVYSNIYRTTFGKTFVSGEYTSKENAKIAGLLCDGINYKYVKTIELKNQ